MKIKRYQKDFFHLLFFCVGLVSQAISQTGNEIFQEVSISSPNVVSLGRYVETPVNPHTGIPQISIPIYTIESGKLSLPIALNYHSGGLKVSEVSNWIGTGWSLEAGGVISRTVRGLPDEAQTSSSANNLYGHLSHGGYNSYLSSSQAYSPLPELRIADMQPFSSGVRDGEPDLFFFNFAGNTGTFYFDDNGQPVLTLEQDMRIEYSYTPGIGKSIASFIITKDNGDKYYFGRTLSTSDIDPVEITQFYEESGFIGTNSIISSWYLNKIESPDGNFSITFSYTSEEYVYVSLVGIPINSLQDINLTYDYRMIQNWCQGVRLSSIQFANGSIDFVAGAARQDVTAPNGGNFSSETANTSAKMLDAIRITNSTSTYCKEFVFNHSYFVDNTNGLPGKYSSGGYSLAADRKRLRLDAIQEKICSSSQSIPPYQFSYYTDFLPRRLSFGVDHWGYNNGQTGNLRYRPTFIEERSSTQIVEYSGADRESNWPAMRAGTLQKITYPTGGQTEYEYEANTTWLSFTKATKTYATSLSMGYDGNPNSVSTTLTATGNMYTLKLINSNGGGIASLNGMTANPGQTVEMIVKPSGGNFVVTLSKSSPLTGYGAEAYIYEWVSNLVEGNQIVGGLRIKKITENTDGAYIAKEQNFLYNESNGKSSGHLYGRPTYIQVVRNDYLKDAGLVMVSAPGNAYCAPNGCTTCGPGYFEYIISPSSVRPLNESQGNHIGYGEIKISQTGNGYRVLRFYGSTIWTDSYNDVAIRYIKPTTCDLSIPNYPAAPLQYDYKRGELKYEGSFNESGQLIFEKNYYPVYQQTDRFVPGVATGSGATILGIPNFYKLHSSKKVELKSTIVSYSPGIGYLQETNDAYFESIYHNQVTRVVQIDSKGQQIEHKFKYALDFRIQSCDAVIDGFNAYQSAVQTCIDTYYSDMASVPNPYWKFWYYQKKLLCESDARMVYNTARKNYQDPLVSGSFAQCFQSAKIVANTELKAILELQTQGQNPLIEETSWRGGKLVSAAYTEYTINGGIVNPIKRYRIPIASPSATFSAANINSNGISRDSRYSLVTSIKVVSGNVVEVVSTDGLYSSVIWGYNNSYPVAKAVGVDYNTLLAAYNAVSGNLTTLRSHSTLQGALLSTYEFNPGVGMTKETDIRARNTVYEYDPFGRIRVVRDHDNNVQKVICYNYQSQVESCEYYLSAAKESSIQRNNCGLGYIGSMVTYSVPAGKYMSSISQADADASASAEVITYGQDYANANGTCILVTIYARAEYQNVYQDLDYTTADLILKFYSDEACTIPYSVTNLNVNYQRVRLNCGGWGSPSTINYTSSNSNGYQVNLGNVYLMLDDGIHCYEYNFTITNGTGYTAK